MNARAPGHLLGAPLGAPAEGVLQELVGFHLARAAVTTGELFDRYIRTPFGLSKIEFSLLMLLQGHDAIAPKQLARLLAVPAPKLTLLLDRMQARGLLKREPNPLDGRSQHVLITPAGRRQAEASAAAARPMEQELLERLSPAEHAMLIELLLKLSGPPRA